MRYVFNVIAPVGRQPDVRLSIRIKAILKDRHNIQIYGEMTSLSF